jgi:hypothetical protein
VRTESQRLELSEFTWPYGHEYPSYRQYLTVLIRAITSHGRLLFQEGVVFVLIIFIRDAIPRAKYARTL